MFKRPLGTKDILPEKIPLWRKIEDSSHRIFSLYNYKEIRLPIIEEAKLFNRSLGESTEIVSKQMFLIDKDTYALRPEGTASIARAYIENNLDKTKSFIKLYYIGPMFRRERPQKGRLRQFHHLGCEAIGSKDPYLDVEIISLADELLKAYSIKGYKIKINSLGCIKDKKELALNLQKSLKGKLNKLCNKCNLRFKRNVLRILDCKNQNCLTVIKKLDIQRNFLCSECKMHFTDVKLGLDSLKIDYELSPYLVRGLDYYTRTIFEIIHKDLGSQDALGAGGRYDNLINDLDGPDVGAIGFAFGIERLLLVKSQSCSAVTSQNLIYLIPIGEEAKRQSLKILDTLRKSGVSSDTDYENRSLKGAMRKANDLSAKYVLIIGENELKKQIVTVRDMVSKQQQEIKQEKIIDYLKDKLSKVL